MLRGLFPSKQRRSSGFGEILGRFLRCDGKLWRKALKKKHPSPALAGVSESLFVTIHEIDVGAKDCFCDRHHVTETERVSCRVMVFCFHNNDEECKLVEESARICQLERLLTV